MRGVEEAAEKGRWAAEEEAGGDEAGVELAGVARRPASREEVECCGGGVRRRVGAR